MELPIYQRQKESLHEWAIRAFHYATQKNPTLSLQELNRLSGWIFTEGVRVSNLRQRVREAECDGLAAAVEFAWQTLKDEARWASRRLLDHNDDSDNWSTVGVVGTRSYRDDSWSTDGVLGSDSENDSDNWSTVEWLAQESTISRDNNRSINLVDFQ